jgi:hypothetical protein
MNYFLYILIFALTISTSYSFNCFDKEVDDFDKIYKSIQETGEEEVAIKYIQEKLERELKSELDKYIDNLSPLNYLDDEEIFCSELFLSGEKIEKKKSKNFTFEATLSFSKKFSEHYQELESAALRLNKMVSQEDRIIFLGRSPSLLGVFYEKMEGKSCSNLVYLNYSGSPDIESFRISLEGEQYRNLVTPQGLKNMLNHLNNLQLNNLTGKLFIVDILGSGACINSFMRLIGYYYKEYCQVTCPEIIFVPMNLKPNMDEKNNIIIEEKEHSLWKYDSFSNKMIFQTDEFLSSKGFRTFEVKTIPLDMKEEITDILDDDEVMSLYSRSKKLYSIQWDNPDAFKDEPAPFFRSVAYQEICKRLHSKTSQDIVLYFD